MITVGTKAPHEKTGRSDPDAKVLLEDGLPCWKW
jgi:hypothetical protein